MNREKKLVKNSFILAIGTFFPKLAIFLTLPILTGCLSKTDYGIYDLAVTMCALVLPAATIQVQAAAFRFLIDVQDKPEAITSIVSNIYFFVISTSVASLIIVFIIIHSLPLTISLGICLYYFFDILDNVNRQIVRGLSKNIDYSISAIISGTCQIAFIAILIIGFNKGLAGGIYALVGAELLSMLFLLFRGKLYKYIKLSALDRNMLKEMLAYSWPMVPNSLAQWVIHSSDRLVITGFMGIQANAVYSVAYKIPSILSLAQTTFNMAWQENASIAANDEDVASYYSSMFKWLFNIVSGMMAVLIGFTPLLFYIFVRGDYSEAYFQMPILFMGMFFLCLSTFWGGIFVAIKQTKVVGTTTVIAALINLGLDILLIRWIGLYAGSISSVVAYLTMCVLRARATRKYMKIEYDIKQIVLIIGLLVLQCAMCFMQIRILDAINLVFGILICVIINRKIIEGLYRKIVKKEASSGEKGDIK